MTQKKRMKKMPEIISEERLKELQEMHRPHIESGLTLSSASCILDAIPDLIHTIRELRRENADMRSAANDGRWATVAEILGRKSTKEATQ